MLFPPRLQEIRDAVADDRLYEAWQVKLFMADIFEDDNGGTRVADDMIPLDGMLGRSLEEIQSEGMSGAIVAVITPNPKHKHKPAPDAAVDIENADGTSVSQRRERLRALPWKWAFLSP